MIAQLYFYIFAQFILLLNNPCDVGALQGEHVVSAKKGEFPFIVSLSDACNLVHRQNHYCGGTLISNKHVLTAAHCIKNVNLSCVAIIVDNIDFESGKIREVTAYKTYDEWAEEQNFIPSYKSNDLAIATLSLIVNEIQPGKISALTRDQVIGKSVVTAGWGYPNDIVCSKPAILQKANLKVLTEVEFNNNLIKVFNLTSRIRLNAYYTAADPPVFTTSGDSGGPLLLASNNEIVGITVNTFDAPYSVRNPYDMTAHLSVDYYRDFINIVISS